MIGKIMKQTKETWEKARRYAAGAILFGGVLSCIFAEKTFALTGLHQSAAAEKM